jgi:hypothetical protein
VRVGRLRILSDAPAASNDFSVTSNVFAPRLTEDQSRDRMTSVIRKLIEANKLI